MSDTPKFNGMHLEPVGPGQGYQPTGEFVYYLGTFLWVENDNGRDKPLLSFDC